MLPLRLIITMVVGGIALWGLFSLLDNLNAPGLMRSPDRAVVKGCDTLDTEETQELCPQLFCQRALFNAKSFSQRSVLRVTTDAQRGSERLIAVSATDAGAAPQSFVCVMQRDRVLLARPIRSDEVQDALAADGDWSKLLSATMPQ